MKVVIFCGGYGTRMWPASRKSYPKQFFPLVHGKSFFQNTVERFKKSVNPEDILVSTEHKYRQFVIDQAPEIPLENIILEPERRDNLGAIGLATAIVHKRFGPQEVMFFSWSDHLIKKEDLFIDAVKVASDYARETGTPVSIDQEPTFPSIHNGWLKIGKNKITIDGFTLTEIDKFIEKPSQSEANVLFKANSYLIHTGYCAWRADTLLNYFHKYSPENYTLLTQIAEVWGTSDYESVLSDKYSKIEKVSIDYGLFEKIPPHERYTIPVDVGWQDAGTWQLYFESLHGSSETDLVQGGGKTVTLNSTGNLIVGNPNKIIALIGVSHLAVIDTPDALLIAPLEETSKVKDIFSALEKDNPNFVE